MSDYTPPINLSFEEINTMSQKGTLDQYILSNGYLYEDVLRVALELADEKVTSLSDMVDVLEETIDKWEDYD